MTQYAAKLNRRIRSFYDWQFAAQSRSNNPTAIDKYDRLLSFQLKRCQYMVPRPPIAQFVVEKDLVRPPGQRGANSVLQ